MFGLRRPDRASLAVGGLGAALFAVAVGHHLREAGAIGALVGPLAALVLDGLPALALVYGARRLSRMDLAAEHRWMAATWSLAGATLFAAVTGATLLVRLFEGRPVTEPLFPLLVAAEAGGLAGLVAGVNGARARASKREAREVTDAFVFVNDLMRHDLRNDLNVVRGHAEAADADLLVDQADEALARIETSGQLATTLLGDPDLRPVDLAAVTDQMAAQVEGAFPVDVRTELPDAAPVAANRGLRSVVDNLLENAAEHNDAADPVVEARVGTADGAVRLTVSDNGSGIPDHQKAEVFEPVADGGGAGGLALVRRLVDAYGGDVWVEDAAPGGAAFVVELPPAADADTGEPGSGAL